MKPHWISLVFLLALALGSCGPFQLVSEQPPTLTPLGTQLQEKPALAASSNSSGSSLQSANAPTNTPEFADTPSVELDVDKLVDLAKKDLAGRLKIDLTQIALLKAMEITWPDVSQGCTPSSGQILTKGQVYGYRVWLEAGGQKYIYHTALTGQVFLCPKLNPGANNPLLMTPDGSTQDYQDQAP
ncbi:MAG: hypothetical protein HYX49_00950 [Chloroflexi bacterium]|nr:hypothetical protein [Chloroflexota bacterium]